MAAAFASTRPAISAEPTIVGRAGRAGGGHHPGAEHRADDRTKAAIGHGPTDTGHAGCGRVKGGGNQVQAVLRAGHAEADKEHDGGQRVDVAHQIPGGANHQRGAQVGDGQHAVGPDPIHQQRHQNGAQGAAERHHRADARGMGDIVTGVFEDRRQPTGEQVKHEQRTEECRPQ